MHMMFSDIWNPFSVQTELPVLTPLKWYDATDGTVSKDSLSKKKRLPGHRYRHNTAAEPADSAKPRVWIKTAIFCSTLDPAGCLAAGRKRKTLGSFWNTDKRGNEKSWFSRGRGHREGRWRDCVSRLYLSKHWLAWGLSSWGVWVL